MLKLNRIVAVLAMITLMAGASSMAAKEEMHVSGKFAGPKANTGTVTHSTENGKSILRVSADFKVPDTPAPTWRVVDSKGNIYTLEAFKIRAAKSATSSFRAMFSISQRYKSIAHMPRSCWARLAFPHP